MIHSLGLDSVSAVPVLTEASHFSHFSGGTETHFLFVCFCFVLKVAGLWVVVVSSDSDWNLLRKGSGISWNGCSEIGSVEFFTLQVKKLNPSKECSLTKVSLLRGRS